MLKSEKIIEIYALTLCFKSKTVCGWDPGLGDEVWG